MFSKSLFSASTVCFAVKSAKSKLLPISRSILSGPSIQRSFFRQNKDSSQHQNRLRQVQVKQKKTEQREQPRNPSEVNRIPSNSYFNEFMSRVYKITGLSMATSLGIGSALALSNAILVGTPLPFLVGLGFGTGIGMIYTRRRKQVLEKRGLRAWNDSFLRKFLLSTEVAIFGLMMSPLLKIIYGLVPTAIPLTIGFSIVSLGCSSLYAKFKPAGQFKGSESTLYSTVGGLAGIQALSYASKLAIGPNMLSLACGRIDMIVGLVLFSAFQSYETRCAIEAFVEGKVDPWEQSLRHLLTLMLCSDLPDDYFYYYDDLIHTNDANDVHVANDTIEDNKESHSSGWSFSGDDGDSGDGGDSGDD